MFMQNKPPGLSVNGPVLGDNQASAVGPSKVKPVPPKRSGPPLFFFVQQTKPLARGRSQVGVWPLRTFALDPKEDRRRSRRELPSRPEDRPVCFRHRL